MKTPMNADKQFDSEIVTDDWPFPTSTTQAPPKMGWLSFVAVGLVLAAFAGVMVSAIW